MKSWKNLIRERLAPARLEPAREAEIVEELSQHLEDVYRQRMSSGESDAEATAAALRELEEGELLQQLSAVEKQMPAREELPAGHGNAFDQIRRDMRYAFRSFRKNPAFAMVAILTLAIGIGANTAIYSILYNVLLKPLPFRDSGALVAVQSTNVRGHHGDGPSGGAPADYWDWQSGTKALRPVTALRGDSVSLKDAEQPELLNGARVATNFFQTLGAKALLGRTFVPNDGWLKSPNVAILSYELWQRKFAENRSIIGKVVQFDGVPTTIVGVMPAEFRFPATAKLWLPFARDSGEMKNRANAYLFVIGRIAPGQTIESAQTEMQTIAKRLEVQYPETNKGRRVFLVPLKQLLVHNIRPALIVLFGAACFVLLISCANVGNLLLARAAGREKEIAIRISLGATQKALLAQLLLENLLLAFAGALLGLVISFWTVQGIAAIASHIHALQLVGKIEIDSNVLLFSLCVTVLASLIFGMMPALRLSGSPHHESLKSPRAGTMSIQSRRSARTFVVTQIATALILLAGAGLFLQSFVHLQNVSLGYDPQNLLTVSLGGIFPKYEEEQPRTRFYDAVLDKVSRVPGVDSAALTSSVPFGLLGFPMRVEARDNDPEETIVRYSSVSPGYFAVLKVPLISGRYFTQDDSSTFPRVAIINRTLMRQMFPSENPLNKSVSINYLGKRVELRIIGVVADSKQEELAIATKPEIYVSFRQLPWLSASLVIRSAGLDPDALKLSVQRAIWAVDKDLPVSEANSMNEVLSQMTTEPRLYSLLLGMFALVAVSLAGVGVYGVVATMVSHRRREFGVRMALGAEAEDLLKLVLGQGLRLAAIGIPLGLAAGIFLARFVARLLYGVKPLDFLTFASVAALLAAVTLLASFLPARRASRTDPVSALRYE